MQTILLVLPLHDLSHVPSVDLVLPPRPSPSQSWASDYVISHHDVCRFSPYLYPFPCPYRRADGVDHDRRVYVGGGHYLSPRLHYRSDVFFLSLKRVCLGLHDFFRDHDHRDGVLFARHAISPFPLSSIPFLLSLMLSSLFST